MKTKTKGRKKNPDSLAWLWKAKRRIYRETKDMTFEELRAYYATAPDIFGAKYKENKATS